MSDSYPSNSIKRERERERERDGHRSGSAYRDRDTIMGEYRGGGSSGGGRMQEEEEDEGRDDRYRDKYRALKAQYRYIKRENELLAEEYESAQTKLKRLKMEKNVLLDRLMLRQGQPGGMVED